MNSCYQLSHIISRLGPITVKNTWLKGWWYWCWICSGHHTSRVLLHCEIVNIGSITFTVNSLVRPGIDCLRMRDLKTWEFVYIWKFSVNQFLYVLYCISIGITIVQIKLCTWKISWVCCCLYCYKCAAQVIMPTATNERYFFGTAW